MRFPDPYALRRETPKETVLFAASQLTGKQGSQEDFFLNFNDECFVIADGVSDIPNGEVAAKLACETAIWAYKHIRQHRYYWLDKRLFMKRIYRTTNMTIWQKRREIGFEEGLATTLLVLMVGPQNIWIGNAGNSSAWLFHGGEIKRMTREPAMEFEKIPSHILGIKRLGLVPEFSTSPFEAGDVLLLVTDGVGDYLTSNDMLMSVASCGDKTEDIAGAVQMLLTAASENGSEDNMTVLMVKRIGK